MKHTKKLLTLFVSFTLLVGCGATSSETQSATQQIVGDEKVADSTSTKNQETTNATTSNSEAASTTPTPPASKDATKDASKIAENEANKEKTSPTPENVSRGMAPQKTENNLPLTERVVSSYTEKVVTTEKTPIKEKTSPSFEAKTETVTRGGAGAAKKGASLKVDNPNFDFGSIHEDDVVPHTFVIKNTGTTDLVIENVKPSCGCTMVDIPLESIPPGGSSEISVKFNSHGKAGTQNKTIEVFSNAGVHRLSLTGTVYPKEGEKLSN
jgi:hypothetical protein